MEKSIEGEAWAAVHRGCTSTLTRLFREQPQLATCRTIFQAASEGDALSTSIVSKAIHALGAAIAGLLHVFDPEIAIIGGPVADAGADLLLPLQEEVWSRSRGLLGRDVPLVEQQVADRSGIVSADWRWRRGGSLVYYWTRCGILDEHADHQRT